MLAELHRAEWGRLLAALIRAVGDFDLAEDALQEAFAAALKAWSSGPPVNARGWLYATARNKAIDRMRREARFVSVAGELDAAIVQPEAQEEDVVPDERLRLIFTCCHPALGPDAQVALTLRTLCGLTTEEIARAFLVPAPTMAQRLVRAKAKIRGAAIPYIVPIEDELPERLDSVMAGVYLVFNEGYSAAQGAELVRRELCAEAIRLARLLRSLLPSRPAEVDGLLALMLLTDARRAARVDAAGEIILLADQDRSLWDRGQIDEGRALILSALRRDAPGPYSLEAAIAAVHGDAARAADTDWPQIVLLYDRLHALHPSPVIALNRAAAVSMASNAADALPLVEALAEPLAQYHLWHSARADLLRRLGRREEAAAAYQRALDLAQNESERRFLKRRLAETTRHD